MAKVIPITERFQHFVEELQESFWGDLQGRTRAAWKFFELDSERLEDCYAGWNRYRPRAEEGGWISQRIGCECAAKSLLVGSMAYAKFQPTPV